MVKTKRVPNEVRHTICPSCAMGRNMTLDMRKNLGQQKCCFCSQIYPAVGFQNSFSEEFAKRVKIPGLPIHPKDCRTDHQED